MGTMGAGWPGSCLTWDGTLQDSASEHLLLEDGPVVVLIHNHDLQVRGLLQGGSSQVQSKGPQLVKQRARTETVIPKHLWLP